MAISQPGLNDLRLRRLMKEAIARCRLDLSGATVLTEAASGAYRVTPVLAAMAGARAVVAIARSSRYGTVAEISAGINELAQLAGVHDQQIAIVAEKRQALIAQADIITNSGHVRPIDAEMVGWLKPSVVVPLMYEAWEFRRGDVDLAACRSRGIAVAGTNERHGAIDVFSFLGIMATKLLLDAGVAVRGSRILLLCDNPFLPFIRDGLTNGGAAVDTYRRLNESPERSTYDAVLVALRPGTEPCIGAHEARAIARRWPGAIVAQFWGDIDRNALADAGVLIWPLLTPAPGHMGVLPSDIGPEPVVRLQAGGLKVAEVLRKPARLRTAEDREFLDELEA
jgi:hypothetical protein